VALKHNLAQKARKLGLDFRIWEQTEEQALMRANFDLVLVSLETAANFTFARIVRELIEHDRISRIIFDEAHLIETQKGFRSDFYRLGFLGTLPTPLFFASATLTSASVNSIRSMLHLGDSMVVRGDISNPNITYLIEDYPSDLWQQQITVRRLILKDFAPGTKTPHRKSIAYFMSVSEVDRFYDTYIEKSAGRGYPPIYRYHSKLTDEEKADEIDQFASSPRAVLVGTSAIGAGFDFADITLVVFAGGAYDFYDFIQGSGRLARTPTAKGRAILLRSPHRSPPDSNLRDFITESICRRRVINRVFNNRATWGCGADEAKCDLCLARAKLFKTHTKKARHDQRARAKAVEFLVDRINFWKAGPCLICFVKAIRQFPSPTTLPTTLLYL
jgi:superfamily II DNA helicase RecQ